MRVPVRYYCPRCGAVATLEREAVLDDKCVTPTPLSGRTYASPDEDFADADGVRIVCGETDTIGVENEDTEGCGEPYYLSFVCFDAGSDGRPETISEAVEMVSSAGRRPGERSEYQPRGGV